MVPTQEFDGIFSKENLDKILEGSRAGRGCTHVMKDLGMDQNDGLLWLQKFHGQAVRDAKIEQLRRQGADDATR